MRLPYRTILLLLSLAAPAVAQPAIVLVRHAERADAAAGSAPMMANDPELSDAGRARAEALALVLEDAGITAIFTTELKRTQQTAAPLAKAAGITPTVIGAGDHAKLIAALKGATGNVLVVGHSNTLPSIIRDLGSTAAVTIGDDEYDNLFIVNRGSLLRLHFK